VTTTLFGVNGNGATGPASSTSFGGTIVEGILFKVTSSGYNLTGYGFWRADSAQSGSASFALWQTTGAAAGTLVANSSVSISGMTAGAWNYVSLPTPIALTSGQIYKAQVGFTGNFPDTNGQFATGGPYSAGITEGVLFAYSESGGTAPDPYNDAQCSFTTSTSDPTAAYATSSNSAYNAWLDVQVAPAAAPAGPVAQNALPGQTWQRAYQHRQQPLPVSAPSAAAPAAVSGTGSLNDTGVKNATGPATVTGTGALAGASAKAATGSSAISATGALAPAGSGGDTPVLPLAAQAGQTWRRQFQHQQQVLPQVPNAAAAATATGTGALESSGTKNATGSSAISGTGALASTGIKGVASSPVLTGSSAATGTGSGGDTPVLPLTAQPGQTWQRAFQHRQQPTPPAIPPAPAFTGSSVVTGTGVLADTGVKAATGSSAVAGTGLLADTSVKNATGSSAITGTGAAAPVGSGADTPVLPLTAQPGRTWRHQFQHPQQILTYLPNTAGSSAITGTGVITGGTPPAPPPFIPPGTVTITPAGPNAGTVTITPAGPNAATVTVTQN